MTEFYKYIVRNGNSYSVMKNNEKYGTYKRIEDALYERDRLVISDWDWEDALELPETDNPYLNMKLPRFVHEYSYIYTIHQRHNVLKDDKCIESFNNKTDAYAYADEIHGEVESTNIKYRVAKRINGKTVHFGQFNTLEEAKERRDELVRNGWKLE